jgi:hypothetical protein
MKITTSLVAYDHEAHTHHVSNQSVEPARGAEIP